MVDCHIHSLLSTLYQRVVIIVIHFVGDFYLSRVIQGERSRTAAQAQLMYWALKPIVHTLPVSCISIYHTYLLTVKYHMLVAAISLSTTCDGIGHGVLH
jgi:hypothetical protein